MEATERAGVVALRHAGRDLLRYRADTEASTPHVEYLGLPGEAPAGRADRDLALAAPTTTSGTWASSSARNSSTG